MKPALIYDGDCPFCANYIGLLKLRENWPDLELINARENPDHAAVKSVRGAGLKIDEGMAIMVDGKIHHGADAVHRLATFGGPMNQALFRSKQRSDFLYPFLRAGRNLALKLLGREKLGY